MTSEEIILAYLWFGGLATKSCPTLVTPWTIALQAPLSMGFSRQEYWSVLPFPSPGDLPDSGIKPGSPALQVDSLPSEQSPKGAYTYKGLLSPCIYKHIQRTIIKP